MAKQKSKPVEEAILQAIHTMHERLKKLNPDADELRLYPTSQDLFRHISASNISHGTYPALKVRTLSHIRARLSEMRSDRTKPDRRKNYIPVVKGIGERNGMTVFRPLTGAEVLEIKRSRMTPGVDLAKGPDKTVYQVFKNKGNGNTGAYTLTPAQRETFDSRGPIAPDIGLCIAAVADELFPQHRAALDGETPQGYNETPQQITTQEEPGDGE